MQLTESSQKELNKQIKTFIKNMKTNEFIVFDTETNGLNENDDVLSISAVRCMLNKDGSIDVISQYDRYYYCSTKYNPQATAVNHLFDDATITKKRGVTGFYPKYFKNDKQAFVEFCAGIENFVGQNSIRFDSKFLKDVMKFPNHFDTMVTNKFITKIWVEDTSSYKAPRLSELIEFYGVKSNSDNLHASSYDVAMTLEVFSTMLKLSDIRLPSRIFTLENSLTPPVEETQF